MLGGAFAIGGADRFQVPDIVLLVDEVPRHRSDVRGFGAGFGEHRDDVLQALPELADKIVGLEFAACVPADLAGHEHQSSLGGDAVGIADWFDPALGLQELVHPPSPFRSSRATMSRCTSVAPS